MGRWGNFFNREAFGGYTNNLFAMQLPMDAIRKSEITAEMWENKVIIDGVTYIQAHPTFLYESLWNVAILAVLLWATKRKRFDGQIFLLYLFGYGAGRCWIEGLRTDSLYIPGTPVRVSQALALLLVLGSAIVAWWKYKKTKEEKNFEKI